MHDYDAMTEPELRAHMRGLVEKIGAHVPDGTGFIVIAAPFGSGGVAQYASNVQRLDAERWMLETIERWHRGDYVPREG